MQLADKFWIGGPHILQKLSEAAFRVAHKVSPLFCVRKACVSSLKTLLGRNASGPTVNPRGDPVALELTHHRHMPNFLSIQKREIMQILHILGTAVSSVEPGENNA